MGSNVGALGVTLPPEVAENISAVQAIPNPPPPVLPTQIQGSELPGGVSAVPIDASTLLQVVVPPCNNPAYASTQIALTICARILLPDGTLNYSSFPEQFTASAGLFFQSDLAPGYLISVAATVSTPNIPSGVVFVSSGLVHQSGQGIPFDTLLVSGYCSSYNPTGWPAGVLQDVTSGQGAPWSANPSAPAVGSTFTYDIPDAYVELQAATFTLTTNATAGNRFVYLEAITSIGAQAFIAASTVAQTASETVTYTAVFGTPAPIAILSSLELLSLSGPLILGNGAAVEASAAGFQFGAGGDKFTSLQLVGRGWL